MIRLEYLHGFGRDIGHLPVQAISDPLKEVPDKERNVSFALPKGRQVDGKDVEPVIQILPELTLADQLPKVLVRCRDDLGVDPDGMAATDPRELPFLEHPEKLGLEILPQGGDLIKEHDPVLGQLELADPSLVGSGEGPLLVTEKLALHQFLGDGGAVYGHEGTSESLAPGVNGPGNELLSRAAFSRYENIGIGVADLLDKAENFLHDLGVSDDIAKTAELDHLGPEIIDLSLQPLFFQGFLGNLDQFP